jgi:pimeloyl-ACP methyl ester carboxylesterase
MNQIDAGRSLRRLAVVFVVALLLVASLIPAVASAGKGLGRGPKPTIVLVHGAWADPSGWAQVIDLLEADGYQTVAPRLDLHSIEGDVAIVRAALDAIPGDKLLVAHSYGGIVISNAAAGRTDILGLVYTAAFVPDEGDSIVTLGEGYTPPAALGHLVFTGDPWASPAYIDPAYFHEVFAADLTVEQAAEFNAAQQPANPAILVSPSGPVAWHDLPTWYAISGTDLIIDPALQRWMADRAGATTIEFKKDSHVGGYTVHARQFTNLIDKAARVTTR